MYITSGTVWLDDLTCLADAEVLEDCTHRGWGVHNCGSYYSGRAGLACIRSMHCKLFHIYKT